MKNLKQEFVDKLDYFGICSQFEKDFSMQGRCSVAIANDYEKFSDLICSAIDWSEADNFSLYCRVAIFDFSRVPPEEYSIRVNTGAILRGVEIHVKPVLGKKIINEILEWGEEVPAFRIENGVYIFNPA